VGYLQCLKGLGCITKREQPPSPLQSRPAIALCDELEAGLVQAQTDGGKLMEAVVHHVLAE